MRSGSRGPSELSKWPYWDLQNRLSVWGTRVSPPVLTGLGREHVWNFELFIIFHWGVDWCGIQWLESVVGKNSREFKIQTVIRSLCLFAKTLSEKKNKGLCCQWRKTTFLWKSYCGRWSWIIRFLQTEEERVGLELILYLFCAVFLDTFALVFPLTVHCCFFRVCIWKSSRGYCSNGKWIGESIRTGSAVQEQAAIVKRWTLVVVQQTFLPDFPGFCVLQLGNGSVEKCNRSSWFIVFSYPVYRLVDTIRSGVQ